MNKIYKVAKIFQKKLALAASSNLENLKSIHQTGEIFSKTKDLWSNSRDPYGSNPNIGQAVDKITNLSRKGYAQATTQGMPSAGQFGYSNFLLNLEKAIQDLENQGPFENLDPKASNALGALKQTISKAQVEFVPVGIPATSTSITLPQNTITARPPELSGAAYTPAEIDENSSSELQETPNMPWSGFFSSTD